MTAPTKQTIIREGAPRLVGEVQISGAPGFKSSRPLPQGQSLRVGVVGVADFSRIPLVRFSGSGSLLAGNRLIAGMPAGICVNRKPSTRITYSTARRRVRADRRGEAVGSVDGCSRVDGDTAALTHIYETIVVNG